MNPRPIEINKIKYFESIIYFSIQLVQIASNNSPFAMVIQGDFLLNCTMEKS
jgi:hypothetical protein